MKCLLWHFKMIFFCLQWEMDARNYNISVVYRRLHADETVLNSNFMHHVTPWENELNFSSIFTVVILSSEFLACLSISRDSLTPNILKYFIISFSKKSSSMATEYYQQFAKFFTKIHWLCFIFIFLLFVCCVKEK